jgi:hypothetical protein
MSAVSRRVRAVLKRRDRERAMASTGSSGFRIERQAIGTVAKTHPPPRLCLVQRPRRRPRLHRPACAPAPAAGPTLDEPFVPLPAFRLSRRLRGVGVDPLAGSMGPPVRTVESGPLLDRFGLSLQCRRMRRVAFDPEQTHSRSRQQPSPSQRHLETDRRSTGSYRERSMLIWKQEIDNGRYDLERDLTRPRLHNKGHEHVPVLSPAKVQKQVLS